MCLLTNISAWQVENCPSTSGASPSLDQVEDWPAWFKTGSHKVSDAKGLEADINLSEMVVTYHPFSKKVGPVVC